jgi:hypothetical protein
VESPPARHFQFAKNSTLSTGSNWCSTVVASLQERVIAQACCLLALLSALVSPSRQDHDGAAGHHWLEVGDQACLSGLPMELLCTMQYDSALSSVPDTVFTLDPLLQARYLGIDGQRQPWLPDAPSIFPDEEIVVSTSTGGFLSGRTVTTTGYVDYLWCGNRNCDTVMDVAYFYNNQSNMCDHGFALAALPNSTTGFGLPHSIGSPKQTFLYRDLPASAGVKGQVRDTLWCNNSTNINFFGIDGGLHVAPARTTAQFFAKQNSTFRGSRQMLSGVCTLFILPNSQWYASLNMSFGTGENCTRSDQTVLLLGLAEGRFGYIVETEAFNKGASSYVTDWATLGWCDNRFSNASNVETCTQNLNLCYFIANVSYHFPKASSLAIPAMDGLGGAFNGTIVMLAQGNVRMLGINVTAAGGHFNGSTWVADGGDAQGQNKAIQQFQFAIAYMLADGLNPRAAACHDGSVTIVGGGDLRKACGAYHRSYWDNKHSLCTADRGFHPNMPTALDFLHEFTWTGWLLNSTWQGAGVYGFERMNTFATGAALSVLSRTVRKRVEQANSQALSETDNILKWPGAVFVLVISLLGALGAVQQGKEIWKKTFSTTFWSRIPKALKLPMAVLVVAGGALLPLAFIIAGEVTTFYSNQEGNMVSYAQLGLDVPGYSDSNPRGNQQFVALVAIQTRYETTISVQLYIYITSGTLVLALLVFSFKFMRSLVCCK